MISNKVYRKLTQMIYRGRLQSGDRLVERRLAEQLGISRIPLRESLARLETEGLVRSVSNSATYVEDFGPEDALEIYSIRLLLEPFATQLVTERRPPTLVKRLRSLTHLMTFSRQRGDIQKLDKLDYAFHLAIVQASQHKRLIRAYECCHIQILGTRIDEAHLLTLPVQTTADEHETIIAAIEAGDPDVARRVADEHVRATMDRVKSSLQDSSGTAANEKRADHS